MKVGGGMKVADHCTLKSYFQLGLSVFQKVRKRPQLKIYDRFLKSALCNVCTYSFPTTSQKKIFEKSHIFGKNSFFHQKIPKLRNIPRNTLNFFDKTLLIKVYFWTYIFSLHWKKMISGHHNRVIYNCVRWTQVEVPP